MLDVKNFFLEIFYNFPDPKQKVAFEFNQVFVLIEAALFTNFIADITEAFCYRFFDEADKVILVCK